MQEELYKEGTTTRGSRRGKERWRKGEREREKIERGTRRGGEKESRIGEEKERRGHGGVPLLAQQNFLLAHEGGQGDIYIYIVYSLTSSFYI